MASNAKRGNSKAAPDYSKLAIWFFNKGIGDDFFNEMDKYAKEAICETLCADKKISQRYLEEVQTIIKEALKELSDSKPWEEPTINSVLKEIKTDLIKKKIDSAISWILRPYVQTDKTDENAKDINKKRKKELTVLANAGSSSQTDEDVACKAASYILEHAVIEVIWQAKKGFDIRIIAKDKESLAKEIAKKVTEQGSAANNNTQEIEDEIKEKRRILRLHLTSDYANAKISDSRDEYCLKDSNNCIPIGWCYTSNPKVFAEITRNDKSSKEIYEDLIERLTKEEQQAALERLAGNLHNTPPTHNEGSIKHGDYVWMRCAGKYYYTRIDDNARWAFATDDAARSYASCNQIAGIKWIEVGTEDIVPGSISMRHQSTLKRIGTNAMDKEGFFTFLSAALFSLLNEAENNDIAKGEKGGGAQLKNTVTSIKEWIKSIDNALAKENTDNNLDRNELLFYKLMGPDGVEDLLARWLYEGLPKRKARKDEYSHDDDRGNYICIPSTSKHSTQTYEYVLLNTDSSKRCFPQVKNCKLKELGNDNKLKELFNGLFDLKKEYPNDAVILFVTQTKHRELSDKAKKIWNQIQEEKESSECTNSESAIPQIILLGSEFAKTLYTFAENNREVLPEKISKWIDWIEQLNY